MMSLLRSRSSSSASSDTNPSDAGKKPRRPPSYNSNKARQERRLELLRLRREAVELQQDLDIAKEKHARFAVRARRAPPLDPPPYARSSATRSSGGSSSSSSSSSSRSRSRSSNSSAVQQQQRKPYVWEEIAGHQLRERRRAERENAQLKAVLEAQIKIAKSLETILNKRFALRSMDACVSGKRRRIFASSSEVSDNSIFEELLLHVEGCYLEVDRVFDGLGLGSMESSYRNACMRSGENGAFVEVCGNNLLPFSVHTAGQAAWQYMAHKNNHLPFRQCYERVRENMMLTDDTIVENLGLELHANDTTALFRLKQVLRRHVEADRVVIVWTAIIDPIEFAGKPFTGCYFRENGYILLKRPQTYDPHANCVLKTGYLITPELSNGSPLDESDEIVGELVDFALTGADASVATAHQVIENMLIAEYGGDRAARFRD